MNRSEPTFTVTHYGTEKQFTSIYAAMRYCIRAKNVPTTIWSPDRPLWQSGQWVEKRQIIQNKKMGW